MSQHYKWKYQETKKRWALEHKDYINVKRRERRLKKKQAQLGDKRCLNCDILLKYRSKGTRIYCTSCVKNYPKEVNNHKCRRSYWRKKGVKVTKKAINTHYVQSWSTSKSSYTQPFP